MVGKDKKIGSSMMTDATSQNEALEALQAFNTAITTTRLYPADAPQVPASVEKAYQAIKHHLRKNGELVISIQEGEGMLCGMPIQKQTLGKLHGADVFQHMRLLDLSFTVMRPGIDRKTFKSILGFFTTPYQKIKNEGGGLDYAAQVGLGKVFPESYAVKVDRPLQDSDAVLQTFGASLSDTRTEWVDFLAGNFDDDSTSLEVSQTFGDPDKAARTIVACIIKILQQIRKTEPEGSSPVFDRIQQNVDELLDQPRKQEVALKTADLLLQGLNGAILSEFVSQKFTGFFGEALLNAFMVKVSNDAFREIIDSLREKEKTYQEKYGVDSNQSRYVQKTTSRLLDTIRGKQFQALEKTRSILEEGEKERRRKRIQAGLNAILQGKISVLENDEVVQHLPQTVERLLANHKDDVAALLTEKLIKELLKRNKKIEEKISGSLGRIGSILVQSKKWDWLEKLAVPFLLWVKEADKADSVYEEIVTVLKQVMLHGWEVGSNKTADQILNVLFGIRSGLIPKSQKVIQLTGKIQDKFMDRRFLEALLTRCLTDPADEVLGQRLSMQGPVAASFLISRLLSSDNPGERIRILDLLANMGSLLPAVIVEKLPEPMPWFGKRNLLKLLAETGNESHMDAVLAYLSHDDVRVQQEAFVCLYKICGNSRKKALLDALALAGETMKIQVVKALSSLVDDEVAGHLIELLQDQENFSQNTRSPLIQQISRTLARSTSEEGREALEKFLAQRRKGSAKKLEPEVWKSVENAIQQIRDNQENQGSSAGKMQENTPYAFPIKELEGEQLITNFSEEQQIRAYLDQDNKAGAKVMLSDLITRTAKMRQFVQAEKLREWLIEIDPLALTEIIQAAEIIESEKTSSIDKEHLETWSGLYDVLTTEEFNALYYSFESKQYAAEEVIIKQGTIRPSLFFINSGRVKLYFKEDDSETLVKVADRGEVLGATSFFSASVWTINAAALGYTEVSILDYEKIVEWHKDYPALESKLNDFCMRFEGSKDFFQKTGKDRRADERVALTGRITAIVLDRYGKETGIVSKGDLTDISIGGTSFFLHISQKRNARLLLGRNVRVVFPTESMSSGKLFRKEGVIVAVFSHRVMQNEYSAHVRFDSPLEAKDMQGITDALKQEQ